MVDPSEPVQIRPQPADDFGNDIANGRLFWQCESYDEYRLNCTIEGIEPTFSRREDFDEMKRSFALKSMVPAKYTV